MRTDFSSWYAAHARRLGLHPDPDAPEHFYDFRAAYAAGIEPGLDGHWDSRFKLPGHPRMFVDPESGEASATPGPGMLDTRSEF